MRRSRFEVVFELARRNPVFTSAFTTSDRFNFISYVIVSCSRTLNTCISIELIHHRGDSPPHVLGIPLTDLVGQMTDLPSAIVFPAEFLQSTPRRTVSNEALPTFYHREIG